MVPFIQWISQADYISPDSKLTLLIAGRVIQYCGMFVYNRVRHR